MFKNKMNAYGFILIVALWVVATFLNIVQVPKMGGISIYLFAIVAFLLFVISLKENKILAVIGLILTVSAIGGISFDFLPGADIGIGLAYLSFAFALVKSESTVLNLLAWAQIIAFILFGLFGLWNVEALADIFGGIGHILVGAVLVYYLASGAGINLPGNLDEQVKEKLG